MARRPAERGRADRQRPHGAPARRPPPRALAAARRGRARGARGRMSLATGRIDRIGVVVHPRRGLERALATLAPWAEAHGAEVVQIRIHGQTREVAPYGDAAACDVIAALGGDGT